MVPHPAHTGSLPEGHHPVGSSLFSAAAQELCNHGIGDLSLVPLVLPFIIYILIMFLFKRPILNNICIIKKSRSGGRDNPVSDSGTSWWWTDGRPLWFSCFYMLTLHLAICWVCQRNGYFSLNINLCNAARLIGRGQCLSESKLPRYCTCVGTGGCCSLP